jgi:ABC-type Na+ efflux pump permease subunit
MTDLDTGRVRAVIRKELQDYRRKRSIVVTMAVLPIVFLIEPVVSIFVAPSYESVSQLASYVVVPLLYMLLIPVIVPATLAAYSVAGEREQGTLEPLLTTPIRQQEFILGKAAAVLIPAVLLSYTVFGLFLLAVWLFANSNVSSVVFEQGPILLSLALFAPLLAGWAVVVGMAVSVRASEIRVAQQLGTLASLPPLGVIVLLAVGVVHPTFASALEFAAGLLVSDLLIFRAVSAMFDRERLVTGAKAARSSPQPGGQAAPVDSREAGAAPSATVVR